MQNDETPDVEPTWLTKNQTATYLNVSRATVERLATSGKLTKYHIPGGSIVRFRRTDVDNLFEPVTAETTTD